MPRNTRHLTLPTSLAWRAEWRQVLEADDALDEAVFLSKRVITLSSAGKFVRAWSTAVRVHAGGLLDRFQAPLLRTHFARGGAAANPRRAGLPFLSLSLLSHARHASRAQDGALLWEDTTYSGAASTAKATMLLLKEADGARSTVAILSRGQVQARAGCVACVPAAACLRVRAFADP